MSAEMPRNYDLKYSWPSRWIYESKGRVVDQGYSENVPVHWLQSIGITGDDPDPALDTFVGKGGRIKCTVYRQTVKKREAEAWQQRVTSLVWHTQGWFQANETMGEWVFPWHRNGKMVFFQTQRDASRGKQTEAKEGKFLGMFFPEIQEAERARLAEWQANHDTVGPFGDADLYPLHASTTPDEIAKIYAEGPHSCMGGRYFRFEAHPTRAYGAGDLAVFYMVGRGGESRSIKKGRIIGRSLCWPERKVFSRVYPTNGGNYMDDGFASQEQSLQVERAMVSRFRQMGWMPLHSKPTLFHGARLLAISRGPGLSLMPYGDGSLYAKNTPDGYVLCSHSDKGAFSLGDAVGCRRDARVTWATGTLPTGPIPEPEVCHCCKNNYGTRTAMGEKETVLICQSCAERGYAREYRGVLYYDPSAHHEEVYHIDARGVRSRFLLPGWWVKDNTFACPYQNARVSNVCPTVTLHDGRIASQGMFLREGIIVDGVNYFSRAVADYVRSSGKTVMPPDFDALAEADYDLVDELADADSGDDTWESPHDDDADAAIDRLLE